MKKSNVKEKSLILQIMEVEKIANLTKFKRLLHHPLKYTFAIMFNHLIYRKSQREIKVDATLFYKKKMKIALPASTDIYLTGGKSHSSEIRLAKFIIINLQKGNHFLDIGAHFGYFTLLASEIVGTEGKVLAFEPARKSYEILLENCSRINSISTFPKAVSDTNEDIIFYEFPNLYSEYNSSDVTQFESESWFSHSKPKKIEVQATTISDIANENFNPSIIKIDVEGSEYKVIKGGAKYLENHSPYVVMEYLEPRRDNKNHVKARELLKKLGYEPHIINQNGQLEAIENIDSYLIDNNLESDNIVFRK